ncbi:hypothetical protein JTB14_004712 [Gonioctena quinquepunctata]|nr:hypothetical protein JTB14_004712 [Gonioctena quinquepunctata]
MRMNFAYSKCEVTKILRVAKKSRAVGVDELFQELEGDCQQLSLWRRRELMMGFQFHLNWKLDEFIYMKNALIKLASGLQIKTEDTLPH